MQDKKQGKKWETRPQLVSSALNIHLSQINRLRSIKTLATPDHSAGALPTILKFANNREPSAKNSTPAAPPAADFAQQQARQEANPLHPVLQ